ncbi:hypothetical protein WA026_012618 [Henosepilachna vigintioctopunctata]|uniref:Methylated-DNA--protein-cysteine methyltransferase n=1 Tax=Henosepilachna vigintioctopunctata TaxID=420089 RepID=A0AAW1U097_9CUCU
MTRVNIVDSSNSKEDEEFIYGVGASEFGQIFLLIDESEVVWYSAFADNINAVTSELNKVKTIWPKASISENNDKIQEIVSIKIFANNTNCLEVKLKGTDFQIAVWKAIANLKEGATASYEDIAKAIGNPKAIRAVASAVTNNKVAYLIPCHRVISKSGGLSKYKWGGQRKMKLLSYEKAI